MATVSFLASRASPAGGFWIALAGGVALARAAQKLGARRGYGAAIAAMLETVAIMGPARFGVPLTQAATAPMLGRFEARGVPALVQGLACGAVRLVHNTATTAFFIWIIIGGLDAYAGTYKALGKLAGVDIGPGEALAVTVVSLLAWAAFATAVQVWVYRRGLRGWDASFDDPAPAPIEPGTGPAHSPRFDPRWTALAAAVGFGVLLSGTGWPLLGAVAACLALAWLVARTDNRVVPTGALLAAVLGLGVFAFALGGGLGLDVALRRALRAVLLVLVATWLRAAAGAEGLREVSRRVLARARRLPAADEAADTLDALGSERGLSAAARSLLAAVGEVPKRPVPLVDAVLGWTARESRRPVSPD